MDVVLAFARQIRRNPCTRGPLFRKELNPPPAERGGGPRGIVLAAPYLFAGECFPWHCAAPGARSSNSRFADTQVLIPNLRRSIMSDHVYKTIELTGSSREGLQEAITGAIQRASETVHQLRWFEVTNIRGDIDKDSIQYWQVSLKVGFTLE
jgi:flavin-binding protein dodecin